MVIQRCLYQAAKGYLSRHSLIQSNIRQTYCKLHHNYSTETPRQYTVRHEWVTIHDNIGTVGITHYAQDSLGDVVFAQLPEIGTKLKAGNECGTLESVKAASEIYSPLSGEVTDINKEVENKPALINTSCYEKGWLFKLKLTEPDELEELMNEEQYETFLKTDVDQKQA